MVTRKAITTAFEIITSDREVKTITIFCSAKNIPVMKTCRVRVTRMKGSPDDYRVSLGRMNSVERAYARREAEMKRLPKLLATFLRKKKAK